MGNFFSDSKKIRNPEEYHAWLFTLRTGGNQYQKETCVNPHLEALNAHLERTS